MKSSYLKLMILVICAAAFVDGQKWSDYNKVVKNVKTGRSSSYEENESEKLIDTPLTKSQQSKPVTRAGIGGWGIIAITLTIIFSGVGIYYFVLFYPIVCKKERMYDVMEMTTV